MEGFVWSAEPVTIEHLLAVIGRPKFFNKVNVILHVAFGSFDIHHITNMICFLIKAQFLAYIIMTHVKKNERN